MGSFAYNWDDYMLKFCVLVRFCRYIPCLFEIREYYHTKTYNALFSSGIIVECCGILRNRLSSSQMCI